MNIQDSQPKGQVRSTRAKDRDGKGFSYTVRNETTSSDEWLIAAKEKEMTTKARLKTLRRAYEIENDMMMGPWKTEVEKLFSIDKIQGSFRATWLCYLQAVCDSNEKIIEIIDKGLLGGKTEYVEATRLIARVQHEQGKMRKFTNANNGGGKLSSYLSAVKKVLGFEYAVAKNIKNFLESGAPGPSVVCPHDD